MTDPLEFSSIGLSPLDSHKLALFVKAFQDSRRDGPYSPKSTRRSFSSSTSSQYSSSESGSRSSTQTILPENDWFKDIHETSHFLDAYDGQGGKQDLLRAVNELEYMITDPQTKHPAITVTSERKSSKSSTRLSDISMFSTTTMVALPEESNETNETCEYVDGHKQNTRVIQNMQPLPLNSPPPYETNTPIKPTLLSPTYPRHEGQSGMAIPRPRKQLTSNVSRPVSMPSYLFPQARIPSLNRTQYNTLSLPPPPDYLESTLGTWGRSKGPILPREEEGREELPPYKCTVYKIGYVNIKFEKDSPSTKSRWRLWRNLYVELWGTALRIYRSEPSDSASGLRLSRLPVLVPWNRYNSTPLLTLSLAGAEASRALDYTKKPNVLRLTVSNGPQLLFKQDTTIEMISWIEHLQAAINISLDLEHRPMPKFVTLYVRGSNEPTLAARTIELERAREVRRNAQEEVLI